LHSWEKEVRDVNIASWHAMKSKERVAHVRTATIHINQMRVTTQEPAVTDEQVSTSITNFVACDKQHNFTLLDVLLPTAAALAAEVRAQLGAFLASPAASVCVPELIHILKTVASRSLIAVAASYLRALDSTRAAVVDSVVDKGVSFREKGLANLRLTISGYMLTLSTDPSSDCSTAFCALVPMPQERPEPYDFALPARRIALERIMHFMWHAVDELTLAFDDEPQPEPSTPTGASPEAPQFRLHFDKTIIPGASLSEETVQKLYYNAGAALQCALERLSRCEDPVVIEARCVVFGHLMIHSDDIDVAMYTFTSYTTLRETYGSYKYADPAFFCSVILPIGRAILHYTIGATPASITAAVSALDTRASRESIDDAILRFVGPNAIDAAEHWLEWSTARQRRASQQVLKVGRFVVNQFARGIFAERNAQLKAAVRARIRKDKQDAPSKQESKSAKLARTKKKKGRRKAKEGRTADHDDLIIDDDGSE
jgi:hypothetical protein